MNGEREITKDQYDRAMENHGYLTDEDMDKVFTTAELCGYAYTAPWCRTMQTGTWCASRWGIRVTEQKKSPPVLVTREGSMGK